MVRPSRSGHHAWTAGRLDAVKQLVSDTERGRRKDGNRNLLDNHLRVRPWVVFLCPFLYLLLSLPPKSTMQPFAIYRVFPCTLSAAAMHKLFNTTSLCHIHAAYLLLCIFSPCPLCRVPTGVSPIDTHHLHPLPYSFTFFSSSFIVFVMIQLWTVRSFGRRTIWDGIERERRWCLKDLSWRNR